MDGESPRDTPAPPVVWALLVACLLAAAYSQGWLSQPQKTSTTPAVIQPEPDHYQKCTRHKFFAREWCPYCQANKE